MAPLPNLLSPITIGPVTLRNRVSWDPCTPGSRIALKMPQACCVLRRQGPGRRGASGDRRILSQRCRAARPGIVEARDGRRCSAAQCVTEAVRGEGGHILLQLLHAGRYAWHDKLVAPSPIRAPINSLEPRELSSAEILATIEHFGRAAALARSVGYHGIEIMGSEGYLLNQFVVRRTNHRTTSGRRIRQSHTLSDRGRARMPQGGGSGFVIMFRLSMLDLVEDGSTLDEVVALARAAEQAGADILNTGIGWHEARVLRSR